MRPGPRNLDHHLQLHGNQWRVRLEIPAPLRPQFGSKRFLVKSLGPVTIKQARLLRGPVLADFEAQIAQARNPDDPALKTLRSLRRQFLTATAEREEIAALNSSEALIEDIEKRDGEEAANTAFALLVGFSTPLTDYLEEWITAENFPKKTAIQHRKAFRVLGDWLKFRRIPQTLQAVTIKVVWEFIEKHLKHGRALNTTNRYLSTYRTHWKWLARRTYVESNPWNDTHQSERRPLESDDPSEKDKLAFTDEQITTLLNRSGEAPDYMHDLMMVAALTGARIDVICGLRVRDVRDGRLFFKKAKREKYDRPVHIHTKLKPIITKRSKGKKPEDYLFDELVADDRSSAASKAFTRYRRKVSIGAGRGEESKWDFHSFRRWFITKAEHAGHPDIVAAVVGHNRPGITFGIYSDGPSVHQMRKCVEDVRLPSKMAASDCGSGSSLRS